MLFQYFSIYVLALEFLSRKTAMIEYCNGNWETQLLPRQPQAPCTWEGWCGALVTSFACAMACPFTDPPRQDKQSAPQLTQPSAAEYNWSESREISSYLHSWYGWTRN